MHKDGALPGAHVGKTRNKQIHGGGSPVRDGHLPAGRRRWAAGEGAGSQGHCTRSFFRGS